MMNFDELKEKLAALGLDDDKIEGVIEAVGEFLKSKIPPGMEGMLESLGGEGGMDDLLNKAKNLFEE
ncbi:MAG: hypothetical protein ACON38_06625 [Akkermansiaceae bacterium]